MGDVLTEKQSKRKTQRSPVQTSTASCPESRLSENRPDQSCFRPQTLIRAPFRYGSTRLPRNRPGILKNFDVATLPGGHLELGTSKLLSGTSGLSLRLESDIFNGTESTRVSNYQRPVP